MTVTQFEVADVITQYLEHDWLRGQCFECQNIFCACLYRIPFCVFPPYREEEIHLYTVKNSVETEKLQGVKGEPTNEGIKD